MAKLTTGEVIAKSLTANGVDTVFGIPGAHMYDFNDALAREEGMRFIHTRHEQGAAYMAYGYARSSGKPGVYTVVPGPGLLNSGAALCTAYGANTPVMCVTGNIMSHLIGQGRGQLHELPDHLGTLKGLTKWADRIDHPTEAGATMAQAFEEMLSGRPRPVGIEAPWDVFGMAAEVEAPTATERRAAPTPDPDAIAAAAEMIAAAKNPMIMVGGGTWDAAEEVRE
ncbi:thiamine pyrophosphate-binding protein, partial [Cognatishimia sp. SS12]|uniref:thiamine pyrophosphate-binding protein n=1 Tax=Cognatishimia sp. SS12 TaxID=2979465 RepID=UPI00232DD812